MSLESTLIDNSENLKLVDTLKELISNPNIEQIKIASGYWDLPGTSLVVSELTSFLERDGTNLQLLIGKDPMVYAGQLKDPKYKDSSYPDDFIKVDLNELDVKDDYQKSVQMLIDFGSRKNANGTPKLEIKKYKHNENDEIQFLHSKCYIFVGQKESFGIIGSSNFTKQGIEGNAELNWFTSHTQDITARPQMGNPSKGHVCWFEEKWALSEEWTQDFLEQILKSKGNKNLPPVKEPTPPYTIDKLKIVTPYEAYIKVLIDQFGSVLDTDGKIKEEDYLPADPDFKRLKYQTEAVNQGFAIMEKHHGFILADVVGLGKTFTAVMVIKRYLLKYGFSKPVLVITPPAIKKSWVDSIEYFDKDAKNKIASYINITTIGCLDTDDLTDSNGNTISADDFDDTFVNKKYGLIIVDESHRFRNSGTQMYQKLDDLIAETDPYVVLLSATPQNNEPMDLANQIYLFQREPAKSTLSGLGDYGNNLESFFAAQEKIYKECIKDHKGKDADGKKIPKTKSEKAEDLKKLAQITNDLRDYVVNQLVIRRTRTDLKKYYGEDIASQELVFPAISAPEGIPYEMTGAMGTLFSKSLDIIAPTIAHVDIDDDGNQSLDFRNVEKDCLGYYRYRAIEFLKDEKNRKLYEYDSKRNRAGSGTINVEGISARLAGMMELHLVKRLESSRDAFEESLENFRNNTQNMLDMINEDRIFICPDVDVNKVLGEENRKARGNLKLCLDELAEKARKQNDRHQTSHNREFKASDFNTEFKNRLENDLALTESLITEWKSVKADPKLTTFVSKIDTFMNKRRNKNQKLIIFSECIATQNAIVNKLAELDKFKILSVTAKNRDELKDVIAENFDANYKGTKKSDYNILITTDVLAEGVNLHEANSLLNYDSPWNATRLMQRLGRINRIGSSSERIYSYNFYPSTKGDEQINLYKRTLVKLQAFHNLFGEDSQIYTTDENLVEHGLVQHDIEESESPNMKFISELKDFIKDKNEKYKELLEIKEPIYTSVKIDKPAAEGFVVLHKTTEDGNYLDSVLYMNCNGKSNTVPQTEFVQTLKDVSELTLEDTERAVYDEISKAVSATFKNEMQNADVTVKSNVKAGQKEIDAAKAKLVKVGKILGSDMNNETSDKIDELRLSLNGKNHALVRKINDTVIEGQFGFSLEEIISEWHKLCFNKKLDYTSENKIIYVIK